MCLWEKHHHEVAPSQHELGLKFGTLISTADNVQLYKYAVHNVAHSFGQTATFMPKPVAVIMEPLYIHQSIWKDGKPVLLEINILDFQKHVFTTLEA